ncbi:ABC transporter ATP-binding protein [Microlunatus endophyticus]|uniref:ABC transporter ATP-binding protein n=1 Tax=Microlunatus endophyticus TaxID=1716077 RepID=A0A917W7L0_9ACTN|nr:ABC transporter ATP-binding protein [Microlunatus endophyticus]GGL73015.1 ABC transporter ATP-binding protein [Microlunatus endophyticus]
MSTATTNPAEHPALLEIDDLRVSFPLERGMLYAVRGLDLTVRAGERLGVVGESGSGKSVSAAAIARMVPAPGRISSGHIRFDGSDVIGLPERDLRRLRGGQIGMIPQSPQTSMNPVITIEAHFQEALALHLGLSKAQSSDRTIELLRSVGIPDPGSRMRGYQHQLSGGMRQRVMIALAIACEPRLLIADEPTTALDVTIQAQILELFDRLVAESDLASILITHNLGIVAGHCDRVVVMYAGKVMETATVAELFARPSHPYTLGLLRCVPRLTAARTRTFATIPGSPPRVTEDAPGCPFAPRCDRVTAQCRTETPELLRIGARADGSGFASGEHSVACWHPVEFGEVA